MPEEGREELQELSRAVGNLHLRVEKLSSDIQTENEKQRFFAVCTGILTVAAVIAVAALTGIVVPIG